MRHRSAVKKLGRTQEHRKALLANLTTSLFLHKRISTTLTKAKALRSFSERIITIGKKETGDENNTAARRLVFKYLRNKGAVKLLFDEIAPKYTDRNGGYTRVMKLGQRKGDSAEMAIIELVDFEKTFKKKGETKSAKKKVKKEKAAEVKEVVEEIASEKAEAAAEAVEESSEEADSNTDESKEIETDADGSSPKAESKEEKSADDSDTDDAQQAENKEGKKED